MGDYLDGPVELRAWRRDAKAKQLLEVPLDPAGRFHSQKTDLLFGTGPGGKSLEMRDAATGELLRPAQEEAAWQSEARQKAEEARQKAEGEKKKAEGERKKAEQRNREMAAEIERLRAQLGGREEGEA